MIMKADDFDDWFDGVQPVPGSNADNAESIDGHSDSEFLRLDKAAGRLPPERLRSRGPFSNTTGSRSVSCVSPKK